MESAPSTNSYSNMIFVLTFHTCGKYKYNIRNVVRKNKKVFVQALEPEEKLAFGELF